MAAGDQTLIADVIDGLLAVCRADAGIAALGNVEVHDGPIATVAANRYRLYIGGTGLTDDEQESATSDQLWAHANTRQRDENITVTCAAWFGDGATDMATARRNALALVNAVGAALRANVRLGVDGVLWAELASVGPLRQLQGTPGATAVYSFTVHARCRIY